VNEVGAHALPGIMLIHSEYVLYVGVDRKGAEFIGNKLIH